MSVCVLHKPPKTGTTLMTETNLPFHCLPPLRRCASLQLTETFSVVPFYTVKAQKHRPGDQFTHTEAVPVSGCETWIIIAQDISFPILTPGIEPGTCHGSEGSFEVLLHLSGFSCRGDYHMYFY